MKTQAFVDLLNTNGNVYAMDDMNVNDGYPIFAQYYAVGENLLGEMFSLYPNPAKDIVNIEFSPDVNPQLVEIYSLDGKMAASQNFNLNTINVAGLNAGVYLMKITMDNGNVFTERIVKE